MVAVCDTSYSSRKPTWYGIDINVVIADNDLRFVPGYCIVLW